ncbi:MAG: hypothetical protein Q4A83_04730 [Bacillota bacterium]|nr:hypothetical protein [Bacillota bacterium]
MTDKELKRLGRTELLEMLLEQTDENEKLKAELEAAKEKLSSREIIINNSGSLAEASLHLNGVFAAAQAAADQYLENIRNSESYCERIKAEAERSAAGTIAAAEAKALAREEEAKLRAENYWKDVSTRLERFYSDHKGLRELINFGNSSDLP